MDEKHNPHTTASGEGGVPPKANGLFSDKSIGHSELDRLAEQEGDYFHYDTVPLLEQLKIDALLYTHMPIKLLTILGGLLSGLFFGGAFVLMNLWEVKEIATVFGYILIIGSAVGANHKGNVFVDTLAVVGLLSGGILFGYGFEKIFDDHVSVSLVLMGTSILVCLISRAYWIDFIAALTFHFAFLYLFFVEHWESMIYLYSFYLTGFLLALYMFEAKWLTASKKSNLLYRPLLMATVLGFIVWLTVMGHATALLEEELTRESYVTAVFVVSIIAVVYRITSVFLWSSKKQLMLIVGLLLLLAPTYYFPSLAGVVLLFLCTFHVQHKVAMVISILGLLYFTSLYYYDLNYTLLTKSIVLMAMGLFLLMTYAIVHPRLKEKR